MSVDIELVDKTGKSFSASEIKKKVFKDLLSGISSKGIEVE